MYARKPIGQSLVDANLISEVQLARALEHQRQDGEKRPIGEIAVQLGFVAEEVFAPFLASYLNFPFLNLKDFDKISREAVSLFSEEVSKRYSAFALWRQGDTVYVAMSDPLDFVAIDTLSVISGYKIEPIVCPENQIKDYIELYYGKHPVAGRQRDSDRDWQERIDLPAAEEISESEDLPFAVSFVNLLIERGYKQGARAIHLQPTESQLQIFFRVNRTLDRIAAYSRTLLPSILTRIKQLASMDASRQDIPQDSNFDIRLFNRSDPINLTISILPTIWGERVVINFS